MKFTTPCFVYVKDVAERKKLMAQLKVIGYRVCVCSTFYHNNTIHCSMIERNGVLCPEVHGVPDVDIDGEYGLEQFLYENSKSDNPSYNCGNNIELFKALAAMNDGNDREQWFIEEGRMFKCTSDKINNYSYHWLTTRKATAEEIVEHFKKMKV